MRYGVQADFRAERRDSFICVPFNRLPQERRGHAFNSPKAEDGHEEIRRLILGKPNSEPLQDAEAMKLLHKLDSDTNINAFALKFPIERNSFFLSAHLWSLLKWLYYISECPLR